MNKLFKLIVIFICGFGTSCCPKNIRSERIVIQRDFLCYEDFIDKVDSLDGQFGDNKVFNTDFKLACLVALSYYPELKNIKIIFQHNPEIGALMRVHPFNKYLFTKSRKKRTYFVDLNSNMAVYNKYSFNALVGTIGHELAHVVSFSNKSFFGIARIGIGHASDNYRTKFERSADEMTIQHGLRYQLYDFTKTLEDFLESTGRIESREYIRKRYMSSPEILDYKL